MGRFFAGLIISSIVNFALLFYAGMADGMCHCMTSMATLFPYGTILEMRTSTELFGMILTYFQFSLYTMIVQIFRTKSSRVVAVVVILVLHALAAVGALSSY